MGLTGENLFEFDLHDGVWVFTSGRDAVLPCDVTIGHQVHGIAVAEVTRMGLTREDLDGYDALVTNLEGCAIGVRTADCIPVFIYDPVNKAVGAVHAGWRGTVNRVVQKTIFKMKSLYRTRPENLVALIGPGISKRYFQVGEEVVSYFKDNGFPLDKIYEWQGVKGADMKGGHHIDLKEANKLLLEEAGVNGKNILVSDFCTYNDTRFYSARREGPECDRNVSAIMLKSSR